MALVKTYLVDLAAADDSSGTTIEIQAENETTARRLGDEHAAGLDRSPVWAVTGVRLKGKS